MTANKSQADGASSEAAKAVLLVGLSSEDEAVLRKGAPPEFIFETVTPEDFARRSAGGRAQGVLGCIVGWDARDGALGRVLVERQALWRTGGPGLAVRGESTALAKAAWNAEIGIEAAGDIELCLRTLVRWPKREMRYGDRLRQLKIEIEQALAAGDYERGRQLIDSLVLIDARTQIYLALLGAKMLELGQKERAEECLRRALIHWPHHLTAATQLSRLLVESQRADEALVLGKSLLQAFDLPLWSALVDGDQPWGAEHLASHPETARLWRLLYGHAAVVGYGKALLAAVKAKGSAEDETVFVGSMRQTLNEDLLHEILGAKTQATSRPAPPAKAAITPKEATKPKPMAEPLPLLTRNAPERQHSESKLLEVLNQIRQVEPDYVSKASEEVRYDLRVAVFHPETNGYQRLAKTLSTIGCALIEGHHDIGALLDRFHSVKFDMLVLWYQEGATQAVDVLRQVLEERTLRRVMIWTLTPSQTAQVQFLKETQDLYVDGCDVVRWGRKPFEDDFQRLIERAKVPESPLNMLALMRRFWLEPYTPPLDAATMTSLHAKMAPQAAKNPAMTYWFLAEDALHAVARGDVEAANALAEKLQATFATSFDARLLGLSVAAKAGQSENVARALVTWFLEQRSAPERALRMARILADCGAADALRQLADALLESQDGATVHQHHAVAGLYYLLADRRREAAAHLERALAMAPARADYAMDLTRTFDRKGVGRAADLWELIARQGLWPRWYCFMMAGETLMQGDSHARARYAFETALEDNPPPAALSRIEEHLAAVADKGAAA